MLKKIADTIDLKTFTLIFLISVSWIIFSDYLVHSSIYKYFDAQYVQTAKGIFYITILSLLLAYSHKREKKALVRRQEDFSRLFYDSPQAMMIFSVEDHAILDVNLAAEQLYGYSKEEFLGLTVFDIRPPEERSKFKEFSQNIASHPIIYKGKWVHLRKNGETFPVEVYARQTSFKGKKSRLATLLDITEMSAAEELAQIQSKMIILGEVSANIGHEIKNPLSIISLASQKLRQDLESNQLDDKFCEELDAIDHGVVRMSETINSLQRLSRNESSDKKEFIYLSALIKESVILMKRLFEHMSVKIEVGHLPEVKILCHQGEMTQVLLNLMKNAYDALISNQVDSKLISIESMREENKIFIRVRNNGPKIDLSIAEQIFKPYFTTKKKQDGTGLGLPISRKIVVSLGGRLYLDLDSEDTVFVIELPVKS